MEPWLLQVAEGNVDAAWDSFIETYRPLILKTIRRTVSNHDDTMDAFAHVCAALSSNDLARVRAYYERSTHTASFPTWLVVVVRNQVVDWVRAQSGRPRVRVPDRLSDLESRVFHLVFVAGSTHAEAYEQIRTERWRELSFSGFLKVLGNVYRASGSRTPAKADYSRFATLADETPLSDERVAAEETSVRVRKALEILQPEDRLAVQLFVLDEVSAADVAQTLGWPNPKMVYNRVYRALAVLRTHLAAEGITPDHC